MLQKTTVFPLHSNYSTHLRGNLWECRKNVLRTAFLDSKSPFESTSKVCHAKDDRSSARNSFRAVGNRRVGEKSGKKLESFVLNNYNLYVYYTVTFGTDARLPEEN